MLSRGECLSLILARLLLLIIALLLYASLYPWHFHAYWYADSPLRVLMHTWPARWHAFDARDIAVNLLAYLPLGFFAFATFASFRSRFTAALGAVLLGFTMSVSIELVQLVIVNRSSSLVDIAANTIGTIGGAIAGWAWKTHHHASRSPMRADALLLAACWVLFQLFPFLPHRGAPRLLATWRWIDALAMFAAVLALARIVDVLGGTLLRRRITLAALTTLALLRTLLYTRNFTVAELFGAALAFALVWWIPIRASLAAGLLGMVVSLQGLEPFRFSETPQSFSWLPFGASFGAEWEPGLVVLLGKLFMYGALLWLIWEAGVRLAVAAAAVAALLTTIEVVQIYMPGRTPEITDPVIAMVLAWVFWSLGPVQAAARRTESS